MSVGVGNSHARDRRRVSLDLCTLLEGQFPDLNGTRVIDLALLTNAREENLARVVDHNLRYVVFELRELRCRVRVVRCGARCCLQSLCLRENALFTSYSDALVWQTRQVGHA